MWMFVDLYVRYLTIELSSLCLFFFFGYNGGEYGPLSLSRTKRERNITIIILVIGYLHVDDYFGYKIF